MNPYNRAEIIDINFSQKLKNGSLPNNMIRHSISDLGLKTCDIISIFESQVFSRHMDIKARELKEKGECFYTIGSSGHESNAVFGHIFPYTDIAFLHYRSGPFFIERSKQIPGSSPLYDMALSFMASSDDPISGGRHKVIGSKKLNVPPQTSTIASHIPKAVGTAFGIDRARDLKIKEKELESNSLVLCSFGDASANHATALSGINTARWIRSIGGNVPIVFICEDNGLGISVPTPKDWIGKTFSDQEYLKYLSCNGLDIFDTIKTAKQAESHSRSKRAPVFLHMKTVRLMGHAGSDIELSYLDLDQIENAESKDPLLYSAATLIKNEVLSSDEIIDLYENYRKRISYVFDQATQKPKLEKALDVMKSIVPKNIRKDVPALPNEDKKEKFFGKDYNRLNRPASMAKLINYALLDIMLQYENALIFGEDVAKKGGVYHITAGLYEQFSIRRVFNSPLDETSILGFASGLAHNGFLPIPEIQFLAYLHNAEDQLRGEAATLSFFSKSQYTNPMIIRIPGLAYQKGFGGHFHNDNSLSVFRDIPGIVVACPSNGVDAVKMLRTAAKHAYMNGRIIVFIEPIALYMTKDLYKNKDNGWCFNYPSQNEEHEIGEYVKYGEGDALTIISYANGLYHSLKAKPKIEKTIGDKIKIIDLCWLSDIKIDQIIDEVHPSKKILIVDECRRSGSYGEGLMSSLYSKLKSNIVVKLHSAEDSFIPLGMAATSTLPDSQSIYNNAIKLYKDD